MTKTIPPVPEDNRSDKGPGSGPKVPVERSIGEGQDTEASEWIIAVVDRPDPRPVWVVIWGGSASAVYGYILWGPTIIALALKVEPAQAARAAGRAPRPRPIAARAGW